MSNKGSVFQKGGGGVNFEQYVQAAFITTLILKGNAPCLPTNEVIEVALQTTNVGWQTDDALVRAISKLGEHKILVQIKHNITFSSANTIFKDVINAFWIDFNNCAFNKENDRLLIVKNRLTKVEKNDLKVVMNFAKTHSNEIDFLSEVNRIQNKRNILELFQSVLAEVNNSIALSDKQLWEFIRCLDVVGYDFLDMVSIDETYFLNLIKISKNVHNSVTEREIWNSVIAFVTKLNPHGGSISFDTIKSEELFTYFDRNKLVPYLGSIKKLIKDSETIFRPLKSTIGEGGNEYHIERNSTALVIDSINSSRFTIVTGKPGVGKSAIIKDVLAREFLHASVFIFRADQFNQPHLANVFSNMGVNEAIEDIFSCIALSPNKLIVIDSLEKLLEDGNPDNAFKQLLYLLKDYPDIKLIGTTRKYALDLLFQKFGIEHAFTNIVEIPLLNESELSEVTTKFPHLESLLRNKKLSKLLESSKYLDLALKSLSKTLEDFSRVGINEFKDRLWNSLVKDITYSKDGMPAKREKAFLEIAIARAREMKLFIKPLNVDEEAVAGLESDEMIFQESYNGKYSPAHDILEDWGLVRYISSKYEEFPSPKELFNNLGNEPAIRRAFRLWIEDYLVDNNDRVINLIRESLKEDKIERYWADELIIAILKSDDCSSFFIAFKEQLLNNSGDFLNRCIHLIRTCCKEKNGEGNKHSFFIPIGSGWREILIFIKENISVLDGIRLPIFNLLYDWQYRFLFQIETPSTEEILAAKYITVYFISQIETGNQFWQHPIIEDKREILISLLYNLSEVSKDEITSLIERASKNDHSNWRINSFYKSVIKNCLSGFGTDNLAKYLPDLIIQTAWKEWKLEIREPNKDSISYRINGSSIDRKKCWGIKDEHSFFEVSIYKTPIYNILLRHPMKGLKFIVDFINYSVGFYANCDYENKRPLEIIEFELNDGSLVKQFGSQELWGVYSGSSVTHYCLECLLVTLEKFLLETVKLKTKISRENIKYIFSYLLKNSNNVAITSVLASVIKAYPNEVEEAMLPLFSAIEVYHWDIVASIENRRSLDNLPDNDVLIAREERIAFNNLPHRTKYRQGLSEFVVDYQFNTRTHNNRIHEFFDKLKMKVGSEDILLKKVLTEIDIRNHKIGEYDEKIGGFPIAPEYDEEVTHFLASDKEFFNEQNRALNYASIISKAYSGEGKIDFNFWEECYNYYEKTRTLEMMDRRISLSVLGLRDFFNDINAKELLWCVDTLMAVIDDIIDDTIEHNYLSKREYNILEKHTALESFHLILKNVNDCKLKIKVICLIIKMLHAPFTYNDVDRITKYIRETFSNECPEEAFRIWIGLIKYSYFNKASPRYHYNASQSEINKHKNKAAEFIESLSTTDDLALNIEALDFIEYDADLLTRALLCIPNIPLKIQMDFIKHFIPLLAHDLTLEKSRHYIPLVTERQVDMQYIYFIECFINEVLMHANAIDSRKIVDLLFIPINSRKLENNGYSRNELLEFSIKVFEMFVYKVDNTVANIANETEIAKIVEKFWQIWAYLFEKIKDTKDHYLARVLFLDIEWKPETEHWIALENRKEFYKQMISNIGVNNIKPIINLLSHAGVKTFLPDGLSWIMQILKENPQQAVYLTTSSGELLVKRLFYNHITKIKTNKQLVSDFITLLNMMVDLGSSEAYLFRENVITFKKMN